MASIFGFARRSIYPELQIERFFRNRVIFSHYGLTGSCICAHPEIRAWEECHEMTKLCRQVARISNQREANAPCSFRDVGVVGINHFTFVTGIRLGGRNMMTDWAEFLAAADYLQDAAGWGFARTPVAFRVRDRATKRAKVGAMVEGGLAAVPRRSDEAMLDPFVALMGGASFVSNVTLPNRGQGANLTEGVVVEANARFSRDGRVPIPAGIIPDLLVAIIADHAQRQKALDDALIADDHAALFPRFASDPLARARPETQARAMFSQMLRATARWLPDARGPEAA
jgi:galacturan 1,4-alpha-galacturonidase